MIFDLMRSPKDIVGIVPTIFVKFKIIFTKVLTYRFVESHSEQHTLTYHFVHVALPIEKVLQVACFC